MSRRSDEIPILTQRASSTRFEAAERMEGSKKKRVLVVGAGAAGELHERMERMKVVGIRLTRSTRNVLRSSSR